MTTRILLLIFIPAAVLLMFALLWQGSDDVSMSGVTALKPVAPVSRDMVLPVPGGTDGADQLRDVEALPEFAPTSYGTEGAAANAASYLGRVSGQLVDGAGKPVADEPVLLLLERDPWLARTGRRDDPERPRQVTGSARSDEEGHFALPARAGVNHTLLAGGDAWARLSVPQVTGGEELRVVLGQGLMLEGTVTEGGSSTPVPSAWVLAVVPDDQIAVRSDAEGHFRIGPLPDTNVLVGAWAPGFEVVLEPNVSPALGPLALELPPGREIRGRVVDRDTQQPITTGGELTLTVDIMGRLMGTETVATLPQIAQVQTATLDPKGGFHFPAGLSMGFDVRATATGYVPERWDRAETRPLGPDDEVVIQMRPLVPRAGRVIRGENGGPVAAATVTASGPAGEFCRTSSDAGGRFLLDAATWDGEGPVFVEAVDPTGLLGARVRLDRDEEELLLQLVPQLTLEVQVVRAGTPVVGAEVAVLSRRATASVARSGAEGKVTVTHRLSGPSAEQLRVQARYESQQSLAVELNLDAPLPPAPLVLDLDSGQFVSGTVSDNFGQPVASAAVSFTPGQGDERDDAAAVLTGLGYVGGGNRDNRDNRNNRDNRDNRNDRDDDEPNADPGARLTGHTDLQGHFCLGPLAPATLGTLTASARDYRERTWESVAAGSADLELVLEPVVRWEGRVLDAASGLPFEDAAIVLQREGVEEGKPAFFNMQQMAERKPGASGDFSVMLPERGRYQIRAAAPNFITTTSVPVDFNGLQPPPFVTLALSPAAVLEVTVLDGRGRPVVGYAVAAIAWDKAAKAELPNGDVRKGARTARTDGNGHARFQLGEGGGFRIAGGPGLWFDDARVNVSPGPPVERTYSLPPTGDLEVTVHDDQGRPLAGVRVEVRSSRNDSTQSVSRQSGAQDPDGKSLIEGLPPGDYDLVLRRRGFDTGRETVSIKGNLLERTTVALKPRAQ